MVLLTLLKPGLHPSLYLMVYVLMMFLVMFAISIPVGRSEKRTAILIMGDLSTKGIRPHLCLNCEYDLKGSVADHCPECGVALAVVEVSDDDDLIPLL
jgi:hypothetical protein